MSVVIAEKLSKTYQAGAVAVPAAAAGFVISAQSIRWGEWLIVNTLPSGYLEFFTLIPLQPDARVFGFMLAAAVLSALLFGIAPAIQATRSNVMQAARGEFTTDFRPARLRSALVIGQVTVSVLFLICAAVGVGEVAAEHDKRRIGPRRERGHAFHPLALVIDVAARNKAHGLA